MLLMIPESKTCGQCLIYSKKKFKCGLNEYEGEVQPETAACGQFLSRHDLFDVYVKGIKMQYKDNSGNKPVALYWAKEKDPVDGSLLGYMPYCPECNTRTFNRDYCEYCGQPFIVDKRSIDYFSPAEIKITTCPVCKEKKAFRFVYSRDRKKINGYCSSCGYTVFDGPAFS